MQKGASDRMDFAAVYRDELSHLRPKPTPPGGTDAPLSALCLSGGGIRSATFALGVLQTLASYGVLGKFDYLSTVSGGGYIGSWLSAWRLRAKPPSAATFMEADASVFAALGRLPGTTDVEAKEISDIRADSNYLTPRLGALSADTWAAAGLFMRNILLNWLIFAPFFMAVIFIPWICFGVLAVMDTHGAWGDAFAWAGPIMLTLALGYTSYCRRLGKGRWTTDARFVFFTLLPVVVAAMCFTAIAAMAPAQRPFGFDPGATAGAGLACFLLASIAASVRLWMRHGESWRGVLGDLLASVLAGAFVGLVLSGGVHLVDRVPKGGGETPVAAPVVCAPCHGACIVALCPAPVAAAPCPALCVAACQPSCGAAAETPRWSAWYRDARVWLAVLGSAWMMLALFAGDLVFVIARNTLYGKASDGDKEREWLGRAAGWFGAAGLGWTLFAAIALFGPQLLDDLIATGWHALAGALAAGGIPGLFALVVSAGSKTGPAVGGVVKRVGLMGVAEIAGAVFAVGLAIGLSQLDEVVSANIEHLSTVFGVFAPSAFDPGVVDWTRLQIDIACAVALLLVSVVMSVLLDVNRFSLHAFYRNRLVRAFLGSARANAKDGTRAPDPFTGLDTRDNPRLCDLAPVAPLHIVNATLNVVATENTAWQERKAEPFTFSPLHSGSARLGYRPSETYASGVTLGTAMAISGAAVSPNMGYQSSPLLGFLLMLFNIRLGWWLGNPRNAAFSRQGPRFALVTLLKELFGHTTDDASDIYLSDGGHFENLGLYEMVRRRCRVIVVSDADADGGAAYENLGNAIRKVRIDFGVEIERRTPLPQPRADKPAPGPDAAIFAIRYPPVAGAAQPPAEGTLIYIKPGFHGDEPADVISYATANREFPHESTADQWFSESQFEAYRALGAYIAQSVFTGGGANLARPGDLSALVINARRYANRARWTGRPAA